MISYDDIKCYFNPFTPALHIQIQVPGAACDVIILNNSVIYFGQEKEIFKQYQTDHDFIKDAGEKWRNTITKLTQKFCAVPSN